MLALFDTINDTTRELLRSLATAEADVTPVTIRYDGELPAGALCPFTTYTGIEPAGDPLFFNEVPVPRWCEIRQGRESFGEILRDGCLIGRVNYEPNSFREVESVDWVLPDRTPDRTDHYDRYGHHYSTTYYSNGIAYQTVYRGPLECEIEVHHVSRVVTMRTPDRLQTFDTVTGFASHFLDEHHFVNDRVLINSLSHPLFVMRRRARAPRTTLFWQEPMPDDVPGNMATELEEPKALERIVFSDEHLRQKVAARYPHTAVDLVYLSPLGQFTDKNGYDSRRAFTLTNSDEIPGLEELLRTFPHTTFSVAALTLMSEKLHALGRAHTNLTLTPRITQGQIAAELERASVYLDINAGAHVLDVVKAAYYLNLVVLALTPQAKAPDHSLTFPTTAQLSARLATAMSSTRARDEALNELHTQHGPQSDPADYRRLFECG